MFVIAIFCSGFMQEDEEWCVVLSELSRPLFRWRRIVLRKLLSRTWAHLGHLLQRLKAIS